VGKKDPSPKADALRAMRESRWITAAAKPSRKPKKQPKKRR
jgi:hypothetical protein